MIFAAFMLMRQFGFSNIFNSFPLAEVDMQYSMLIIIGLLTSIHCIAMCGGINLSQCIPQTKRDSSNSRLTVLVPSFLYNLGRVISYTIVGAIVGGLGGVISFDGSMKGIVQLAAGLFMIVMGINMLGIFPFFRKFNIRIPNIFSKKIDSKKSNSKSPLFVGLLNGLMPCGPLQAMQLYALSTGSVFEGAISMFLFSASTVPLMFIFGALSSVLSKKFANKVMSIGAVLVIILGLSMFSSGWALSGFSFPSFSSAKSASVKTNLVVENGVQIVRSKLSSGKYPAITVQAGLPVKWIIEAPEGSINGCNNRMIIPAYKIEYRFKRGENIIEFTPTKTGTIPYSCWMGMIRSSIKVVETADEIPIADSASQESQIDDISSPIPANYKMPIEKIAIAKIENGSQKVDILLTDNGFSPAIIVFQAGISSQLNINNKSSKKENSTLLIPAYFTKVALRPLENQIFLNPSENFDFSNENNTFYAYIIVVKDIASIDIKEVKKEASKYQPMIYPSEIFSSSCH
jgi:sulfite exporter TauE/SafE/plastocyanin domain-containing protein